MADERDPKVSRRYGELGAEEPPRALDQSILSAARRAVDRPHAPLLTPAGRHRWYFPLAAAAILVLAVAVTVQVERQQPDPEAVSTPPAPWKAEEKPTVAAPPPVFAPDPQPSSPAAKAESAGPAADAARAPAEESRAAGVAAQRSRERVEMQSASRAMARQAESPERWLERIAQMRKEGRHEEADKALADFRRRYPDYRISDAMLEKVEKK